MPSVGLIRHWLSWQVKLAGEGGHYWNEFDLLPVSTSSVKLTALSVYSTNWNGLVEIEFYTGSSECLTEYN